MKDKEHWTELWKQAAVEQDPKKLLLLVTEINRLLAEKQGPARATFQHDKEYN
jgi:hypothetical protein